MEVDIPDHLGGFASCADKCSQGTQVVGGGAHGGEHRGVGAEEARQQRQVIVGHGRQQIGEFFSEKLTGLGAEYDASGKLLRQGFWATGELKTPIAESAALTGAPAPATPVPGGPQ